ncbi:TetR/AcrR family transcriptional regulator [Oceanimonas sp. NS1]|nr:TetR/AcrR family transcriptional regulator [Oceanimonas sp. NS1]
MLYRDTYEQAGRYSEHGRAAVLPARLSRYRHRSNRPGSRVTPRTLYRHFPSKEQLVIAVLQQRETRFLSRLTRSADDARDDCLAIFDELEQWFAQEGEKGCLFLRALGEYSHKDATITELALTHKRRELECLCRQLDDDTPERLRDRAESLMLILEGAVSPCARYRRGRRRAAGPATRRPVAGRARRVKEHSPFSRAWKRSHKWGFSGHRAYQTNPAHPWIIIVVQGLVHIQYDATGAPKRASSGRTPKPGPWGRLM